MVTPADARSPEPFGPGERSDCPVDGTPGPPRPGVVSRRRFLTAALLATGAVGLAACTLAVPTPTPAVPTAAPGQAASDLAIGVVLSLSGRYSREGALMRAGYEVWADAVGQAGGLKVGSGRRPVRLFFADDESEPLNAGRQAERIATTERIRLWLGPFTSAISTAVATVADRVGAVVVAPDASAGGLYRRGLKGLVSILAPDDRLLHGLPIWPRRRSRAPSPSAS